MEEAELLSIGECDDILNIFLGFFKCYWYVRYLKHVPVRTKRNQEQAHLLHNCDIYVP